MVFYLIQYFYRKVTVSLRTSSYLPFFLYSCMLSFHSMILCFVFFSYPYYYFVCCFICKVSVSSFSSYYSPLFAPVLFFLLLLQGTVFTFSCCEAILSSSCLWLASLLQGGWPSSCPLLDVSAHFYWGKMLFLVQLIFQIFIDLLFHSFFCASHFLFCFFILVIN